MKSNQVENCEFNAIYECKKLFMTFSDFFPLKRFKVVSNKRWWKEQEMENAFYPLLVFIFFSRSCPAQKKGSSASILFMFRFDTYLITLRSSHVDF